MIRHLSLHTPHGTLFGQLELPEAANSLIFLVRSHHTPIDVELSAGLARLGHAVCFMDLLTSQENAFPDASQNVPKLAQRLIEVIEFIQRTEYPDTQAIGMLALGDAAPAALRVAAQRDQLIKAVVTLGGMLDRAGRQALEYLSAPLLILQDTQDAMAAASLERARSHLGSHFRIEAAGLPNQNIEHAHAWFTQHLPAQNRPAEPL